MQIMKYSLDHELEYLNRYTLHPLRNATAVPTLDMYY